MRDPAIKLFGKEIMLPDNGRIPVVSGEGSAGDWLKDEKVILTGDGELDTDKDSQRDNSFHSMEEDDPKTPQIIEEHGNEKPPDTGNETNSSDQKPLKKPDKIIPCPRCNSMDTKFCYFNNYNVNQPRHFCKGCQRYWTAGGTMRSVPVGAGRRKNKNSNTHCRQVMITEALMDIPKKVISFAKNDHNGSDCSSGSSNITTLNSIEGGMMNIPKSNGFVTQVPCLQGYPWPYPAIPNPRFCPPGYPIPVYPIPYWNCNVPWIPPPSGTNQIPSNFSPLGKHSRNGDLVDKNNCQTNPEKEVFEVPRSSDGTILIPKTLRIDDPDEAAKSSIWATLGIKNDPTNRKGLFKGFEPKGDEKKNYEPETPTSMRANPAAMSRSLNFLENT